MESEEAIMENENNSNLESESNIRDRDQQHQTHEEFGNDNVGPFLTEPRDVGFAEVLWGESLPTPSLNIDLNETPHSSTKPKEIAIDKNGEHCDNNFQVEGSTEITVSSVSTSAVREKCVSDYEDFIVSDSISTNKINSQSRFTENVDQELAVDEAERCKDVSHSRSEEEMEVDNSQLELDVGLSTRCLEHTNGDQQIGANDIIDPDFCSSDQESKLIDNNEISEESVDSFEIGQTVQTSSQSLNLIPSCAKNWEGDVDLLGEVSVDFTSHKDNVVKEEMQTEDTSIPHVSGNESTAKDVCEEFEESREIIGDDFVTEESLESPSKVGMIKQSTSRTVTAKSSPETANLVSPPLKVSELLSKEDNYNDEISQSSPNDISGLNNEKVSEDSGEATLHLESTAFVEECEDVTFDKTFSYSFCTQRLQNTDSHITKSLSIADVGVAENFSGTDIQITEDLRNTESDVPESLRDRDSGVTKNLKDNNVLESLSDADKTVAEDISNDNQCCEILSFEDDKLEVNDSTNDSTQVSENDLKTGIVSSEIHLMKDGHLFNDTSSESYDSHKTNVKSMELSEDDVTEMVHDVTTSSGLSKQLDIVVAEDDDTLEENLRAHNDVYLHEFTAISDKPKQFDDTVDKDISVEHVMEDMPMMVADDLINVPDLISSKHHTQFDSGVQKNNIIPNECDIDNPTLMIHGSGNVPVHIITSGEHQKQQDTNISDATEEIASVEGNYISECKHSEQDLVTDSKIESSENGVKDTKEIDIDSFSSSVKFMETTSADYQKDSSLDVSAEKDNTTEAKMIDVQLESAKLLLKVEDLKDISSDINNSETENKLDVLGNKQIFTTVSGSMEVAGEISTTPETNETVESKTPSSIGDKKIKIKAKLTEKDNKQKRGTKDNEKDSTSTFPPPTSSISSLSQEKVVKNSIKPEIVVTDVNEVTKNSVSQMKKDSLSSKSVRQCPSRSKRANAVKNETVNQDCDDVKIVSVKSEALGSKVAENGLDGCSASGQQYHLQKNSDKSPVAASSKDITKTDSLKNRSSKSKVQTCLVCQKICKCKYNIVRNGDVKHLCDDACFKQFRKTPSVFLKSNDNVKPSRKSSKSAPSLTTGKDTLALYRQEMESRQKNNYRTCAVCQLLNLNTSEPFCNWKGLDFCGESCLGKFQANLNTSCSFCHAYIPIDMRATCCIKIGNDMRPFCKQRCYNEFKKKLRMCAFCQRDVAGVSGAFTAMVGSEGKFKEFCSQTCMKRLESEITDLEIIYPEKGGLKPETITCSICRKRGPLKYTVQFQGMESKLCSDICLSAFKYSKKINLDTCDNCRNICTTEEVQAHFVHFEGQMKHFCSDNCVSLFRKTNSKVVQCMWCGTKKINFDMIEKQDVEDVLQVFCSLNCLSLHRVNLQAKSGQVVSCDQCRKVEPAQYHLTMSDASVRNFCSYSCVMTFQSHFATKYTSPASGPTSVVPSPQLHPQQPEPLVQHQTQVPTSRVSRGRINTRQATAKQQSPFPVISNVVSLAVPHGGEQPPKTHTNVQPSPQASPQVPPPPPATTLPAAATAGNIIPSADGKHQILIQAAPPKSGKNKSSQCRPVTQSKSTLCKPNVQNKDTQTDEMPPKCIMVPIPVPVYIPMPTVMYSAPAPKLVPFPIPIPVPIFIPTTRKSASGISKAIQEIVERIPSDPLEAELLMMAEAVAADRRPGDSDTDSEADTGAEDFGVPVEDEVIRPVPREDESLMLRKREGQGEEDMIQMALRMAEEMSGPIEDLETSVEPVVVSSETTSNQHQSIQSYETQVDEDYIPSRSAQRGAKRQSRGRPPSSRVKRPRVERYNEDDSIQSDHSAQLQSMEPPPDANYRLKFTYGVNAWRHWIIAKNAQIEKTRQMTGSYRLRPFSTDILKCTTEELNYTLCMFIREVRKPSGDEYSPDSIYYLCLGIQQYLYENNRIDNIFTDTYFEKFTDSLNEILKTLQPKVNSQGQMLCRIEEEHLWESKQLGAHSPFILLNTLIYFHTKHFILKTAQEHMALSFAQILKHWKKGMPIKGQSAASGKNVSLRFYCLANGKKDGLAARKNKDGVPVYEVTENFDNPLRCPVKLYEFFLSKCPESIKNRNDIFYPVPERSCVPDSPVWYSTQSIDVHTMDKMLTRVLLVREIQEAHLHAQPVYM